MYRTLVTACLLAVSCGDTGTTKTAAHQAPVRRQRFADAAVVKPSLPRPPKLTAAQRLANELAHYRVLRQAQRAAVRGVKLGGPLARTSAGKLAYGTFVRMHTDATVPIAELRRVIYAELTAAETAIKVRLARLPETPLRRDVRDPRAPATIARAAQRRAVTAARLAFTKTPEAQRIRIRRSPRLPLAFYTGRAVFLNLHRTNRPPAHLVEAIIFHETVPGHHLENRLNVPNAAGSASDKQQDNETFNGFIEGWGLYAEQLAADLNLYSNDLSRLGRLELRAWRASRAAVDIGLHYEGWSIDRARKFMTEHTVLSATTIRVELSRVLNRPGRVQAYVIGAKTILDLRSKARTRLGPLFSLPEFHSVVLGSGRIPLTTLTRLVNDWIDKVQRDQRA